MPYFTPDRDQAFALLTEFNQNESLIRHGLAVEAVMRHFACKFGEDPELWGLIGLVHDLDYEQFPEQHCFKCREILTERNWPESYIRAIESHGWKLVNDVEPHTQLEKVLYTIDELTGLIAAAALVRPSKSILDIELKSVKKKWKEKSFAAGVNRDVIIDGAALIGMELDEVIAETILGMQTVAEAIGLKGYVA